MVAWLQKALPVLRDVVLLGLGVITVLVEIALWAVAYRQPSWLLTTFAGSCLGIPAAFHITTLARGGAAGSSSPSSPPPSLPRSPSSQQPGGFGEQEA